MYLTRRVKTLVFVVCLTIGLTLIADDDDENREASVKGGGCPLHAIIAVEAGDARERFDEFERELKLSGLLGNHFQNPEVIENRIGSHRFSAGLSAHQTLFAYLAKKRLAEERSPVSGHGVLRKMREYFDEPLETNLLFPFLKVIGIDPSLTWEDAPLFVGRSFGYLDRFGMSGHGFRRSATGETYAVARIEGELYLYVFQPAFVGPRKGRLGVFEWRRPHKPVGKPEHIVVFAKYLADQGILLFGN